MRCETGLGAQCTTRTHTWAFPPSSLGEAPTGCHVGPLLLYRRSLRLTAAEDQDRDAGPGGIDYPRVARNQTAVSSTSKRLPYALPVEPYLSFARER